jgi:hypothetical protein
MKTQFAVEDLMDKEGAAWAEYARLTEQLMEASVALLAHTGMLQFQCSDDRVMVSIMRVGERPTH